MTFDSRHYVPVLKAKRAEKTALSLLPSSVCAVLTPLMEIVERKERPLGKHLDAAFRDLALSVRPFERCFIDAREIAADGPDAAAEVFDRATTDGIAFTPVTGISRTADVQAALSHVGLGLAIRLTREEFEHGDLADAVTRFVSDHNLAIEQTDLIVDLGAVDDMVAVGVEALAAAFSSEVPEHTRWRTFTLSACAFPQSMGGVERHSHDFVDRVDWMAWRDSQHARRADLPRLPTYSDGAIQHPSGVEGFDGRIMQVSAAIRYTVHDQWLLVKGESTRRTLPTVQFQALATQLVYGHLKNYFYGKDHCAGCACMKAAADGAEGFGSAEAWRRLGTAHHITTVVEQLRGLPWP